VKCGAYLTGNDLESPEPQKPLKNNRLALREARPRESPVINNTGL